jgi:inorganic triphosphatase YgiF
MSTPKEIEIKLELSPASLPRLKKIPLMRASKRATRRSAEVSVYFDTDKHKLRKKGLMLRVRRVGRRYTQTIKATGGSGLFERDEWESGIAGPRPDFGLARGTALEALVGRKLRRGLKPMFETRVARMVYPLTSSTGEIAFTVDRGTIVAGRRSAPLCEIELELKRGGQAELFNVARELMQAVPARLEFRSKSQRGYELLDDQRDPPVMAERVDLVAGTSTCDGFKAIGRACLKQIVGNEPALLKGDPEGVHQMRVGLRRLRAALSLFAAILSDPQTAAIKTGLQWLQEELGPAREFEVLMKRVVAPVRKRRARWDGVPSLSHELAEKREAALSRAQDAVKSARFHALTLDIAAWLETGDWTKPQDDRIRHVGRVPIEVSAARQLRRRWKKIRKRGKAIARLDAKRRHKLRIQTKKVRYATEFFGDLFPGKRASKRRKRFLPALEALQDALGDLNDIAVHEELIGATGMRRRRVSRKRAFATGVLMGHEDARLDAALAAAIDAYAELATVKRFWA